jgi:arginase
LLPDALRAAGLHAGLGAGYAGRIEPPPYDPIRDPDTKLLNPRALHDYSRRLAQAVTRVRENKGIPVVLGGDCSNLIGCMLALRHAGRFGLFFIDGHADFYQPEVEPNGEVASMDLAIVSGRGPAVLADIDGLRPLVRDDDIVAFGYRDAAQQAEYGSQDIRATPIRVWTLDQVLESGVIEATRYAVATLSMEQLDGLWIHIDVDVLDDTIMPAVDYRMPGGMQWNDLSAALRVLMRTRRVVGVNIGIFNPRLDPEGTIAGRLVACLVAGLATG